MPTKLAHRDVDGFCSRCGANQDWQDILECFQTCPFCEEADGYHDVSCLVDEALED